jgi:hypothetical protein
MKRNLLILITLLTAVFGCTQKYELDTEFTMPTELASPSSVVLDVTSSSTVVLSWKGGKANDGGIVLYNVLFDEEGGDFSDPIATMPSDLGAGEQLTLTHAALNTIARKAGIKPNETGKFIWTVTGAKGGVVKSYDGYASLSVTRGDGIDNMPEKLYINGAAAKEAGQEFRVVEEGLYVIYTKIGAGAINFTSEKSGGFTFYADNTGKLVEGEGSYNVDAAPASGLARVTVNFNTLGVKIEEVGTTVRLAWGATYSDPATDPMTLEYVGGGEFKGQGEVVFYGPGREGTPDWCSWVEERYYFIADVNGAEVCWGSDDAGNAILPDGTEEHFYLNEFAAVSQWDNLWKMDHALDLSNVAVTIYTNKDNKWTHSCEKAGEIVYEQPKSAPAELYIAGSAAETEGAAFRKASEGVFVIYQQLKAGNISFYSGDAEPVKYFHDAENKLFIGARNAAVEASEGVTRITVDFNTNTVTYDQIGADVKMIFGVNKATIMTLSYQGAGKFVGEGAIAFVQPGDPSCSWLSWVEERYHFLANVNGTELCWGRLNEVDGENRPDPDKTVADNFFHIGEYAYTDQWQNLWKLASELDGATATVTINTNDNGAFTHSFVKASADPVPPTMAPAELALYGSGAEVEGQPFRQVSNGVFEVYAKLKDGSLAFKSSDKNYFVDAEKGLLQGAGEGVATASGDNVTRIVVNYLDNTVKFEQISKVRCIFAANYVDLMNISYIGQGKWEGEGVINFLQPGSIDWLSWVEERYYFIVTIDGVDKCWGRKDNVTGHDLKPSDEPDFYDIQESTWSQWDHCWKFAGEMDGANVHILIDSNKDGVMTHVVTKK